jgi:hypothetical protein
MRLPLLVVTATLLSCSLTLAGPPAVQLCEPWQSEYTGEAATGKQVIALWPFNAGAETEDASGHGHKLEPVGAQIRPEGRFGGALETFCGWPVEDKPHRAIVKNHPELSPKGAFTIELWICPKPELNADYPEAFLIDKKYVAHADYQLILDRANKAGERVVLACLGFGGSSDTWYSRPAKFEPGTWHHLAFTYDGAGTGSFSLDGVPWGSKRVDGRRGIVPGDHPLSIGDRIGSYYHGFPGLIDQVRISNGVLEFRKAKFERVSDRNCFVRMEPDARLRFAVTNLQPVPLAAATVKVGLGGFAAQETTIKDLAPGAATMVDIPLDTRLRPGEYTVETHLAATAPEPYATQESFPVRLVARRPPNQFPVLMWGIYGGVPKELERLKTIGFTHVLGMGADCGKIWEAGQPTDPGSPESMTTTKQTLDLALANDLTLVASLSPGHHLLSHEEFLRVDRKGEKLGGREDICGLFPEIQKYCYNVGASMAQGYGQFPAFGAALVHTEVRDGANCCFHPHDLEAFRKATGLEIPPEINAKWGVQYGKLPDFPASRVIPDNHPIYLYYRWYWKQGDGWNELNSQVVRGLKSTGRKDFWTFNDPSVRVASVYGSGGEVDAISQWTYSYPDPIRIAVATDELLAMAGGRPGQNVMKMTQIIWYRSQTAPEPKKPEEELSYKAQWEREDPTAPFITIAPMHLREAFWTKIARPIKGIMYHGWQSLVPCESSGGYRFTHPDTQHELARLIHEVVRPLGPTLLQVPGAKSDVAFLESFASQMFARRGTYGWGGHWEGDAYQMALWAHLQPEIVYDETIVDRGLDGYRVLVMPNCDVITEKMAQRINAFQAAGGIIVGDDRTAPAIKPDIVLKPYDRTGRAREDKAALVALASELRRQLDSRYTRYADSTSSDVIPYRRQYKDSDYVFVVNDQREYGEYVGHHGRVMENGLPTAATLSLGRGAGSVYDLVEHRPVAAKADNGRMLLDVALGPCDGRCYLVTSRPIEGLQLQVPDSIQRGKSAACSIAVVDAEGKPIDAVVPLEVTIRDARSAAAEFSGFYGAADGRVEIPLDIAQNDPAGVWTIEARDLASGRTATANFRVPGTTPWPPTAKPMTDDAGNPVQPKG